MRRASLCFIVGLVLPACTQSNDSKTPCGESDEVCERGFVCVDAVCRKVCASNADCPKSQACEADTCQPGAGECAADADCNSPPSPCWQTPGTCEAGACSYTRLEDGIRCEADFLGTRREGQCADGECVILCPSQAEGGCPDGSFCQNGTFCTPEREVGEKCPEGPEACKSDLCVDGYCCDSQCPGDCRSCDPNFTVAGEPGCGNVVAGEDPRRRCGDQRCDGQGACFERAPGADCEHGYQCDSGDCAGGICLKFDTRAIGASCRTDQDKDDDSRCNTGYCSDGVCCDAACDGDCVSCLAAATDAQNNGECAPLPATAGPHPDCGSVFGCNGAGACVDVELRIEPMAEVTNAYPVIVFSSTAFNPQNECKLFSGGASAGAPEQVADCNNEISRDAGAKRFLWQLKDLADGQYTVEVTTTPAADGSNLVDEQDSVSATVSFRVESDKPVAWWRFDRGSGDVVEDHTASKNHGLLMAEAGQAREWPDGPHWTSEGVFGSGVRFSRSLDTYAGDHVFIPASGSLASTAASVTIEGWVRFDNDAISTPQSLLDQDSKHRLFITGAGAPSYKIGKYEAASQDGRRFRTGRFYHVAITADGEKARAYLNGRLVRTWSEVADAEPDLVAAPVTLGFQLNGEQYELDGVLDEFRIFPYARTPGQIEDDASALSFRFEGDGETRVEDSSPYANHGVLAAAANRVAAGVAGQALELEAENHVEVGTPAESSLTEGVTLEAWVWPTSTEASQEVVGRWDNDAGYTLAIQGNAALCPRKAIFRLNGAWVCSKREIPTDGWTQITATYNGDTMALYIDEHLDATRSVSAPIAIAQQTPLRVGSGYAGLLDEVHVFPNARYPVLDSCKELRDAGVSVSGVYRIDPGTTDAAEAFDVYCEMQANGGGWTLIAYAGTIDGSKENTVGPDFFPIFHQFGAYDPSAPINGTPFSRPERIQAFIDRFFVDSSEFLAKRTSVPNKQFIWPVADANSWLGDPKSLPYIDYIILSNDGANYFKHSEADGDFIGVYNPGEIPRYTGYDWNCQSAPGDSQCANCDDCGLSFDTGLNHRSLLYWEKNDGVRAQQWFHGSPLSLTDSTGPDNNVQDIEIYLREKDPE